MSEFAAYLGLVLTSLIAGTLLPFIPGSSEAAMGVLLAADIGTPFTVVATAVAANSMGAAVNYFVGRNLRHMFGRPWFPIGREKLETVSGWFRRFGIWTVGFCFIPTFGDAINVVAGLLRSDLRLFLPLAIGGKLLGHLAVAAGVSLIW